MWHASWSAARYATSETPRTGVPTRGVVARAPTAAPVGTAYRAVVARGLTPAPVADALAAPVPVASVARTPNAAPVAGALAAPATAAHRAVVARGPDPTPVAGAAPVYRAVIARGPDPAPVAGALAPPAAPVVVGGDWKIDNTVVGVYINAKVFMLALVNCEDMDPEQLAKLEGKTIREMGRGQTDKVGEDVSGHVVLSDAGAAILFKGINSGRKWANNHNMVNVSLAPSLTYIDSGHNMVCLLRVDL